MLNDYRALTKAALPEDDSYIIKLGIAIHTFASVLTFLCEVICIIEPTTNRTNLQAKTAGGILGCLMTIQNYRQDDGVTEDIQFVINEFKVYKDLRDDIVHSYCITGSEGKQILHRTRGENNNFEVTESFLDSFIESFSKISDRLYKIRGF